MVGNGSVTKPAARDRRGATRGSIRAPGLRLSPEQGDEPMTVPRAQSVGMGAMPNGAKIAFRVWAPHARRVAVIARSPTGRARLSSNVGRADTPCTPM